jgi:ATP-dependent RNA helicase DeaD
MGFIEDIETILGATPSMRQTALFSATLSPQVRKLAKGYMHKPQSITIKSEGLTVANIEQRYSLVNQRDKTAALARLLEVEPTARAIVFVRTRADSTRVADELSARGFPAEALNGDMDQSARSRTLNRFRGGQVQVLVGTDVAARGLDIDEISHVFNHDLPTDPEVYVHRIGRTGRAGRSGVAISLVAPGERNYLRRIEGYIKQSLDQTPLPTMEEIEQGRTVRLQEQLVTWIERGRGERERGLVEVMAAEGYDPIDIATAALKLLSREQGQQTIEAISEVRMGNPRGKGHERAKRRNRAQRDDQRTAHEAGMVRLMLNTGRNQGIRPNEVVSTLAYHGGIPGNAIGKINIHPQHTLVDVPEQFVGQILAKRDAYRIRRQAVRAELAQ